MKTGIHIGAIADKGSLDAMADALIRIIQAGGDQKTARAAIAAIGTAAKVEHVSISNVYINNTSDGACRVDLSEGDLDEDEAPE